MADFSMIGTRAQPFTMSIEWGKVREFARAIKDPNPIYYDPELAHGAGLIPIPVTFLMTSAFWQGRENLIDLKLDMSRGLHGEQEFEYFAPIFVGDTLTGVARLADLYEKQGARGGRMTFAVVETEFTNQRGELVARARSVTIETGQIVQD